jgi:RNA polymerase sigma-70 factor (sigma-E family)
MRLERALPDTHPALQIISLCLLPSADNLAAAGVVSCSVRRRRASRTLAGGDEAEFSAFVARDGGQLLGFAFLLVGNRHDAEDLVQQALLRTAGRWPAARQSPAGYSRTVLLNLVRDRWRARQRRHAETLFPDLTALPSASDASAAVLDRQLLLRACRRLPLQQRAVLVLRFWEDRSVEETATVLGCTAGTVKSHTYRALARLREALTDPASAAPVDSPTRKETAC